MRKIPLLLALVILLLGVMLKIYATSKGNFIFNMDNARDMVDIREMVVLKKPRLIAHTSAIEGVFYGPAWYYLSSIPFILSGGNPYGSILLVIFLWAIGGYFLLKLVARFGIFWMLIAGVFWIASNTISLATLYAYNPNPVILLTPLFVYLLEQYFKTGKLLYSILAWGLGGLFSNFELNFGVFIPFIILASSALIESKLIKSKNFWIGSLFFILCLLPQVLFELRHDFLMTKSLIRYLNSSTETSYIKNPLQRIPYVAKEFINVIQPTLMNYRLLLNSMIIFLLIVITKKFKSLTGDSLFIILACLFLVPYVFYIFIPVTINSWHLGAMTAGTIILVILVLRYLQKMGPVGKVVSIIVGVWIVLLSLININGYFQPDSSPNMDPSLYKNELAAIDYVYKSANGKNFKAYTYMPSVIDYPYQYLFWWYGKIKYGYIPGEYAYSPNKPQYISNKDKFEGRKDNFSGLVYLIKEPDRIHMRQAWENDYQKMKLVSREMVGPLEVEVRQEDLH